MCDNLKSLSPPLLCREKLTPYLQKITIKEKVKDNERSEILLKSVDKSTENTKLPDPSEETKRTLSLFQRKSVDFRFHLPYGYQQENIIMKEHFPRKVATLIYFLF